MHWSFSYHGRDIPWYDWLALENGFWETLTSVTLAAASVFLTFSVIKYSESYGLKFAKWPPLLLALLFFIGAGEEISWGQHWFGFETPAVVKSVNAQKELNIHNINSHLANHLMSIFF